MSSTDFGIPTGAHGSGNTQASNFKENRGYQVESRDAVLSLTGPQRVASAVGGVLRGIIGAASQNQLTKSVHNFREVRSGKGLREVYSVPKPIVTNKLGYNPLNTTSMLTFIDKNEHRLMEHNGYQYLLNHGSGTILFIPRGDREKVFEVRVWNVKDGTSLSSETKLKAFAKAFIIAYPGIEKDGEGLAHFVFDIDSGMLRGYKHVFKRVKLVNGGNAFQNADLSLHTGKWIQAVSKESWKDISALFDPAITENKQSLDGDKLPKKKKDKKEGVELNNRLNALPSSGKEEVVA